MQCEEEQWAAFVSINEFAAYTRTRIVSSLLDGEHNIFWALLKNFLTKKKKHFINS